MSESTARQSQEASDRDHAAMREAVTALTDGYGASRLDSFSEVSCLGSDQPDPQTKTMWQAVLKTERMTIASANRTMDALRSTALKGGFEPRGGTTGTERRDILVKGVVGITASQMMGSGQASVEVLVDATCRDHPESHVMRRDESDPNYGLREEHYEDAPTSSP